MDDCSNGSSSCAPDLCLHNLFDSDDISSLFAVGVVISLLSSAVTNLGANVQKLALNRETRRADELSTVQRPMYSIPLWVGGFVLFIGAQGGDALALRFAPQSVVQPAGAVSLLANLLFGYWLNNEPIGKLTPIALTVIIVGVGLIVTFGPKGTAEWEPHRIAERWLDMDVLVYAAVAGGAALSLLVVLSHYDRRITRDVLRLAHEAMARADAEEARALAPAPAAPREPASDPDDPEAAASAASDAPTEPPPPPPPPPEPPRGERPHALSGLTPRERRLVSLLYPVTAHVETKAYLAHQHGLQAADRPKMAEAWGCSGPESANAGASWRRIWPN